MNFQLTIGNSMCQITPRLSAELAHAVDQKLAFGIEGAKYTQQFMNNGWDGFKHMFSTKTQKFPTGFLADVQSVLAEKGLFPEIRDLRVKPALPETAHSLKIMPWDHQLRVFEACLQSPRGLVQVATGGGKTLCIAGVWGMLNVPGVLLVFRKELMYQLRDHISRYLGMPVGIFGDGKWEEGRLTICMAQSLMKVAGSQYARLLKEFEEGDEKTDSLITARKVELHKKLIRDVEFVAIDETHRAAASGAYAVIQAMENAYYRYGFSATAYGFREDKKDFFLKAAIGDVLIKVTTSDLVNIGHLVPTDVLEIPFSHKGLRHSKGSYHEYYDSAVIKNDARNKIIVETAFGLFTKGQKVLIAVQRVDHGKLLEEYLAYLAGPHNVKFIYGEDESNYRKEHLTAFADEKLPILISTLVGEGWDVPWMKYVINCRGEESRIATIQLMGRSMRKYPGKDRATYIDIMDQGTTWLARHARTRSSVYAGEPAFNRITVQPKDIRSYITYNVK